MSERKHMIQSSQVAVAYPIRNPESTTDRFRTGFYTEEPVTCRTACLQVCIQPEGHNDNDTEANGQTAHYEDRNATKLPLQASPP